MKTDSLKTWCRIDLDAIAHNYNYTFSKSNSRIICVIKANGYGHGAVVLAKKLEKEGCNYFAVSSLEEALELRQSGIYSSILVLGYILPSRIIEAIDNGISFSCASLDFAKTLSGIKTGKKAQIHIKLNSGMNRTGFDVCREEYGADFKEALSIISNSENILVEGVFSHFACAEDDKEFSVLQANRFTDAVKFIKSFGIHPEIIHLCNSAGIENYPDFHFDAARLGIHLYGLENTGGNFIPAMEFYTRIVDIHTICSEDGVSYGLDFKANKQMKIAVIGAGYADGLTRHLSHGKGNVLINGIKCPIIGRICMDMAIIDISGIDSVSVGDIVEIWGKNLSCDEQAKNAGTISYELACSIAPRVKRVYSE